MSQRPGIQITKHESVDGGEHPNRYIPAVSAHIRLYWPAHVDLDTVTSTLEVAYTEALDAARARHAQMAPRERKSNEDPSD